MQGFVPIIFSQICFLYLSYIGFSFCFYYCKKLNLAAVVSMIGIMYANGVIFWYFDRIYAASNYLEKNKSLERELLLQKEYHEALLAQQVAADELWHDIKKHLSLAKELMRFEGSYASNAYICAKLARISHWKSTNIFGVSSILCYNDFIIKRTFLN